jgi:hypothetical protein
MRRLVQLGGLLLLLPPPLCARPTTRSTKKNAEELSSRRRQQAVEGVDDGERPPRSGSGGYPLDDDASLQLEWGPLSLPQHDSSCDAGSRLRRTQSTTIPTERQAGANEQLATAVAGGGATTAAPEQQPAPGRAVCQFLKRLKQCVEGLPLCGSS